jgi:serine/threonine protein kinase
LDQACRNAPELRRTVEALLADNDRAGSFLAEPLLAPASEADPSGVTAALSYYLGAGKRLGRYTIIEPLGSGGMGVVYRARDEKLERLVALKILAPGRLMGEDARRRFRKEALALAKLNHDHIAAVYDVGDQDGVDYIVMECVSGESLAAKLRSGPLPVKDATLIALQVAEALEDAHESGVIHRDLKPANIMITPKGNAKVLDFGLAKLLAPDETLSMTETHILAGTPLYMSPEQAQGRNVNTQTDLWSLGAVYYESLTGRAPFHAEGTMALLRAIIDEEEMPLRKCRARSTTASRRDHVTRTGEEACRALSIGSRDGARSVAIAGRTEWIFARTWQDGERTSTISGHYGVGRAGRHFAMGILVLSSRVAKDLGERSCDSADKQSAFSEKIAGRVSDLAGSGKILADRSAAQADCD